MINKFYNLGPFLLIILLVPQPAIAQFPSTGNYTSVATGTERPFDRFSGQFILVETFATYCTPCKLEQYELSLIYDAFGDNLTIFSLSVSPSTDSLEDIRVFRADAEQTHGFTARWEFGLDQDSVFGELFSIGYLPTTFLFDDEGNVVKRWEAVVTADVIGSYIDANVTFPVRDRSDELIDSLLSSALFRITLIAVILALLYKIMIPDSRAQAGRSDNVD